MKFQKGFTLIEIVMVLVLLGILSAVAVPKYFDLQKNAEEKALQAMAAEIQATLNGSFAQGLLSGLSCSSAVAAAITEADKVKNSNSGYDFVENKKVVNGTADADGRVTIQLKSPNWTSKGFTIAIPKCSAS